MVQPNVLVAGPGTSDSAGFVDGVYTEARFNSPAGMAMANDGYTAYICDYGNNAIRALDTKTREVTTYASGSPLDKPIHLCVARSGNLYVTSAQIGDRFSPVVRITPGRSMSVVGQAHQPRGIAVDADETILHLNEQGHTFFTEIWRSAHSDMTMGGAITDRDEFGTYNIAEGMVLAPDGYLYGVSSNNYFYSSGAGFKRFVPGGTNTWNESGAPPGQTGYGPFSSPTGGDYGVPRRCLAVRNGSDGRMWFYSTVRGSGVYLTKINLGATGGIFSDEQLGAEGNAWGVCLNSQDTIYFSSSGLSSMIGSIQGSTSVVFYSGVGSGMNSIYLIGCPPFEPAVASEPSIRLVADDGVVTVRGHIRGAPEIPVIENRDRCGRPVTAEISGPSTRLRARER